MRAAAAHKVKDFCLNLDKGVQEQVSAVYYICNNICNILNNLPSGDHDPAAALRQGARHRRQPARQGEGELRELLIYLIVLSLDDSKASVITFSSVPSLPWPA